MPKPESQTNEKLGELLKLLQSAARGLGSMHNSETHENFVFTSSLKKLRQGMEIVECLIKQSRGIKQDIDDARKKICDYCYRGDRACGFKEFEKAIKEAEVRGAKDALDKMQEIVNEQFR